MKTIIEVPVSIGDTIYVVPSKTNFELNIINNHEESNKVYEQVVSSIQWWNNNRYCVMTCDGMECHNSDAEGKTWFTEQSLAHWKLDRLKESRWNKDGTSKY